MKKINSVVKVHLIICVATRRIFEYNEKNDEYLSSTLSLLIHEISRT